MCVVPGIREAKEQGVQGGGCGGVPVLPRERQFHSWFAP